MPALKSRTHTSSNYKMTRHNSSVTILFTAHECKIDGYHEVTEICFYAISPSLKLGYSFQTMKIGGNIYLLAQNLIFQRVSKWFSVLLYLYIFWACLMIKYLRSSFLLTRNSIRLYYLKLHDLF